MYRSARFRSRGLSLGLAWFLIFSCQTPRFVEVAEPVLSEFQAWADANKNGVLDEQEVETLLRAVQSLVAAPHPASTPVDLFFDSNRDKNIDLEELETARRFLFGEQLLRLSSMNPQLRLAIDFTSLGEIDEHDIEYIMEFLFKDVKKRWPRSIKNSADEKLDNNKDGFVDEKEIENYVRYLYLAASLAPLDPVDEKVRSRVDQT